MLVTIEISPGELLDRLTILEIKEERIKDSKKLENIAREKAALECVAAENITRNDVIDPLWKDLKAVNERLWDVEDEIRQREKEQDFGREFIALARSVYFNNDDRARLKREINKMLGSSLFEEKSYVDYGRAN